MPASIHNLMQISEYIGLWLLCCCYV